MPEGRMPMSVLIGTEVSFILICTVGFGSEVGFGITESGKVSASLGELAWGQDEDAGGQGCLPRKGKATSLELPAGTTGDPGALRADSDCQARV